MYNKDAVYLYINACNTRISAFAYNAPELVIWREVATLGLINLDLAFSYPVLSLLLTQLLLLDVNILEIEVVLVAIMH